MGDTGGRGRPELPQHVRFPLTSIRSVALLMALSLAACAHFNPAAGQANAPGASGSDTAADPNYGAYMGARYAASRHDIVKASELYQEALKSDPDNDELLNGAFFYAAAAGDMDTAEDLAQRLVKTEADGRAPRLVLAVAALKKGDFAAARMNIAQSARGPFTGLTLTLLDAWAAQGTGDTALALKELNDVPDQGGTATLANYTRALVLEMAGRDKEADAAYQLALGQGNSSPRLVEAYGRFLERAKRDDDARALYNRFASQESLQPVCEAGLARIAAGTVPDPLIATAQQGAAEALFGIGTSLSDQSSSDIAVLYLQLALNLDPHHDLARLVLADRYENLQKYEDAIATYRAMDQDGPYWPAAAVQAAVDLGKLKRYDEAVSELQDLGKQWPDHIAVWTALGDIYRDQEKYTEAADAYDKAIKTLNPVADKDWPLFYARAVSEERSKQWPDAERDLLQALKLSPDQPEVLNYLGYSWVDQGKNLPQALAMLEKARTLSPYDGYIVDSVGWAYYRLGRYDQAVTTLENAVQLVPGDATINDHLGDAYWKAGRKLEARYQWANALAFEPDAKEKAGLEAKLKNGLTLADGGAD